jgi:hypothetical protein
MPEQYRKWRERLTALHPGWDVRLWTAGTLSDYDEILDRYDLRGYHPTIASDVFRVMVVLQYGGFYLDCDTEPLSCLEPLREHSFVCRYNGEQWYSGRELRIASGYGFGAEADSQILASYLVRCEAMQGQTDDVLWRVGFLGLSAHLWAHRGEITLLPRAEWERYCRHEGQAGWSQSGEYRPIPIRTSLPEPFKKSPPTPLLQSREKSRPWPSADEMLRHHRGPNTGCCGRPSTQELRRK